MQWKCFSSFRSQRLRNPVKVYVRGSLMAMSILTHRGVARLPKHSFHFVFCPSGDPSFRRRTRRNPVKVSFAKNIFFGVARWPKHSFHFVFCPSGDPSFRRRWRRNPVKVSFAKNIFFGVARLLRWLRFRFAHSPACPSGSTFSEANLAT